MYKLLWISTLALTLAACNTIVIPPVPAPQGTVIYGLTPNGKLATFGSMNAASSTTLRSLSGVDGTTLVDLDMRPADGKLYALSSTGQLYTLNPSTGEATLVNMPAEGKTLSPTKMDFNPAADRTRVFGVNNMNFRINQTVSPYTPIEDGVLTYVDGTTTTPNLVGAAYTNSQLNGGTPPASTVLFSVDSTNNQLVKHEVGPTFSSLRKVGALGITLSGQVGFDIGTMEGMNTAYLVNGDNLYTVNLTSGGTTFQSKVGATLKAIAVKLSTP